MDDIGIFIKYEILKIKYTFLKWSLQPEQIKVINELKKEEKIKQLEGDIILLKGKIKKLLEENKRLGWKK